MLQHHQEKESMARSFEAQRAELERGSRSRGGGSSKKSQPAYSYGSPAAMAAAANRKNQYGGTGGPAGTPAEVRSSLKPVPSSFASAMQGPPAPNATPGGGAFGPSSGPGRATRERKQTPQRVLSLKQLKDQFITLISDSKMRFDRSARTPICSRETMEMHMYTFLNQRYGLKSLIVEHASAIIQAVTKYSTIDNDTLVFGKIIRNEIDEEFRFVQKQLKETVVELLRVKLKGTFQLKTDAQINQLVESRCRGYVEHEEWKDIIRYMYNHEDGLAIMVLCRGVHSAPACNCVPIKHAWCEHPRPPSSERGRGAKACRAFGGRGASSIRGLLEDSA